MKLATFIIVIACSVAASTAQRPFEQSSTFWQQNAQQYILDQLRLSAVPNINRARNVILFMGDGMSLQTVAAVRAYIGGEEHRLSFERFPHFGLSRTYSVNRQVSDSANTATAYLHGVKSTYGTIGVNAHVELDDCAGHANVAWHTTSIAGWAQDACKATGLVTTTRVTHASPAALYAHSANREWENDAQLAAAGCDPQLTPDIARQLIEDPVGQKLRVILGCGRRELRPRSVRDEDGVSFGSRTDGRDLIDEWQRAHNTNTSTGQYVWTSNQLHAIDTNSTDYLLGLFGTSHCPFHGDRKRQGIDDVVPSLSEMTLQAIRILETEPEGYFLFVESGRIDQAHHATLVRKALEDTTEFDQLIERVRRETNESDTLLVVTADHSHVMTYNGYSKRGQDVLGLAETLAGDGLSYPVLSYANGPGFYKTYDETGARRDWRTDPAINTSDADLAYMAMVPMDDETHGGDDVGVYASGPWSHLFTGAYEQNAIPIAIAYSAGFGAYADERNKKCSSGADRAILGASIFLAGMLAFARMW